MTNPTRREIINAYSALDDLRDNALEWEGVKAQKQYHAVLKILPPIPQPTMDEIKWDDDKHYLAEAESARFGKVVMLGKSWAHEQIDILVNNDQGIGFQLEYPADLTPTGKRYTLTEVEND